MRAKVKVWAGGEHAFRLPINCLEAVEEECGGDGPWVVLQRLLTGTYRVRDVRSVLRLGLVGGGMAEADAARMVKRVIDETPLHDLSLTAADVLYPFILDDKDDPVFPKAEGGDGTGEPQPAPDGQATMVREP